MRKYLPYVLFFLGAVLLVGAGWYYLHTTQANVGSLDTTDAPQTLASLPLVNLLTGKDAIQEIQNMHLGDFQVDQAVIANYGSQNAMLLVADAGSADQAANLIAQMTSIIAGGGTSYTPMGVYQFSDREVHGMEGMDQFHFFFQSGTQVVWLSAEPTMAEQALIEAMQFYP